MDDDLACYVGADAEDLAAARTWLTERLHHSWLLDEEIDELNLAITEALTNLLVHTDERSKSELTVRIADQQVDIYIRDDSPPFVPGQVDDPEREGGYGLLLLNMLTDEVVVGPGDTGGSVLQLTKRRPPS